jgi:hypothetical protein
MTQYDPNSAPQVTPQAWSSQPPTPAAWAGTPPMGGAPSPARGIEAIVLAGLTFFVDLGAGLLVRFVVPQGEGTAAVGMISNALVIVLGLVTVVLGIVAVLRRSGVVLGGIAIGLGAYASLTTLIAWLIWLGY